MNDQERIDINGANEEEKESGQGESFAGKHFSEGFAVHVRVFSTNKSYYFHTDESTLIKGTPVVVETIRGIELGVTVSNPRNLKEMNFVIPLQPIIRVASAQDVKMYEENLKNADEAMRLTRQIIDEMDLDMHLVRVEYTLDGSKLVVMYVADNRVDFRELLRELAAQLHVRIEMRQIGSRDRSKMVGGIGICGLPICCSTFLGEFDGISINMAKNQFLALNIQKLSGHCGKLICCLKYEDSEYTELRRGLPRSGQKVIFNNLEYKVSSINVLTRLVKLEGADDFQVAPLDDVLKLIQSQSRSE